MVALIIEMGRKALGALLIVSISGKVFRDLLSFGENTFQTTIVLSFYVYCFLALFFKSRHKLFHVLSIPVFTQFLHLFQKYSFPAGANSLWRLLPFILLAIYFFDFFLRTNVALTKREKLFLVSWIATQFYFLSMSPNLPQIALGGFLLFLVILPMYFLYLRNAMGAVDFSAEIEKYLCLIYLILGVGTFGLVIAGASYAGSDNLLATRNISDTNVTMAYFILLWPFALLFFWRNALPVITLLALLTIFTGVVIFSFSRGAVFIITPYLLISIFIITETNQIKWLALIGFTLFAFSPELTKSLHDQDLTYFWALRFGDFRSVYAIVEKLQMSSGRAEIHSVAYTLFLKKPLLGHGTGSFEILGPGYREAHSLLYTLLAEQGVAGAIYMYTIFGGLATSLLYVSQIKKKYVLLFLGLMFYLVFNHTVGSVFVIIPGKSITINCIAPILLLCLYFYGKNIAAADSLNRNA